jgi:hypothetical protein
MIGQHIVLNTILMEEVNVGPHLRAAHRGRAQIPILSG